MWSYSTSLWIIWSHVFHDTSQCLFSQKCPSPFFKMLIFYISVSKHTNRRALMVSWLIIFKLNKQGCFSSSPNSDSPVFLREIVLHGPVDRTKAKPHMSYIWALKPTIMRLNRWLVIYLVQISAPSSPSHAEGRFKLILCEFLCQRFTICCKENKVNEGVFTLIGYDIIGQWELFNSDYLTLFLTLKVDSVYLKA